MRLTPLLLLPALLLTGCAGEDRVAAPAAAVAEARSLAADLAPLHAEALLLADLVMAGEPPAEVAEVVQRVADGTRALTGDVDPGLAVEGAALAAGELEAVRAAAGEELVRLGLDGLLRNALATVQEAKQVLTDASGASDDDRALAERVLAHTDAVVQDLAALA